MAEKRKATERVQKLEAEREKLLKQVKDTTLTVQKVSNAVDIEGKVWWKAKMFDVDLKNAGYVSGSKMVNFITDQGRKMDASLKEMKALIASCTELFSAKEKETSSSYSDLTPHDMMEIQGVVVRGGNQHVKEVEQVEDITAITAIAGPPISATKEVVPIFTPGSSKVGEEFQMVARDPPPLAILAPGFPPDGQRSAPLAPEVAETADRVGVIPGSDGHEVSVPPPHDPSLAADRANRHEGGSMNEKEAKLKKRKDRE
jgi:hypothetical protein